MPQESSTKWPRLPEASETMQAAQARFPAALARLWDIDAPDFNIDNGPGKQREHVFDLDSGLRFIASREKTIGMNHGEPYLHFSVSFHEGSAVEQVLKGCKEQRKAKALYLRLVRNAFAELSGMKLPAKPSFISKGGIVHWMLVSETKEADHAV